MKKLTKPMLLAVFAAFTAIVILACDRVENPFTVSNDTPSIIFVRLFGEFGEPVRWRKSADDFGYSINLNPGEESKLVIAPLGGSGKYTFVIEDQASRELNRRTFTRDELNRRRWRLMITETEIR